MQQGQRRDRQRQRARREEPEMLSAEDRRSGERASGLLHPRRLRSSAATAFVAARPYRSADDQSKARRGCGCGCEVKRSRRVFTDRMVLSVRRRIHCGIGLFWRCFLARIFFTLNVLLDG